MLCKYTHQQESNKLYSNMQTLSRAYYLCPERILGIIGWDPSDSKINWLHVHIF